MSFKFEKFDEANLYLGLVKCMIWVSRVLGSVLQCRVKKCDPVDVDFVNHKGLEDLGKGIEYLKFKAMYWQEPSAIKFEDGLHLIEGESDIDDMCYFPLNNNLKELHIYFEHPIDNPITPEVLLAESSSSSDSYESA
ncbi:hypothetical protein PIB30_068821 [Stylosanthes scabra]|uniref:PB1-like domain-containing protein n=1 Tax=Stylosanthes scabra TaxID=79078 RepID=A0ABU6SP15_9FABA|nr:hypothetical protein [Stylosanthes scabra]